MKKMNKKYLISAVPPPQYRMQSETSETTRPSFPRMPTLYAPPPTMPQTLPKMAAGMFP